MPHFLERCVPEASEPMKTGILSLEADHPGFNDPEYRKRRDEIARAAGEHKAGETPPRITYTENETATWKAVFEQLAGLHDTHACREYNEGFGLIGFQPDEVPQLADVDAFLRRRTGFRIMPVAGLVESRHFLAYLAQGIFPATQYIRHHSVPLYTPEPDVAHELLGHVPMLATQDYADLSQKIGEATLGASDEQIERFGRLYWYTVEFGLVRQSGALRAYGAGLLSSYGELEHALGGRPGDPEIRPFDPDAADGIPNPITTYQPILFEVPSLHGAFESVSRYIERIRTGD
jgi:phenylalanine-4-hydroxylase